MTIADNNCPFSMTFTATKNGAFYAPNQIIIWNDQKNILPTNMNWTVFWQTISTTYSDLGTYSV